MKQYIDKAAIMAEIKGYISNYKEIEAKINRDDSTWVDSVSMIDAKIGVLQHLLAFLDTLEVKENNLVEEIDYEDYVRFFKEHPDFNDGSWGFEETWTFAQYCYKLGLKAREGE